MNRKCDCRDKNKWDNVFDTGSYALSKPDNCVLEFANKLNPCESSLDIGCGLGRHLPLLKEKSGFTAGIDISEKALTSSKSLSSRFPAPVELLKADMLFIPFKDNSFDIILAWRVFHIGKNAECRKAINEAQRILKPGGRLFASIRSSNNTLCFLGEKNGNPLEERTFRLKEEGIDGVVYHFFNEDEIRESFSSFGIKSLSEVELEHTSYTEGAAEFKNMFFVVEAERK